LELLLNLEAARDACRGSPLLDKAFNVPGASLRPIAEIFGGAHALLTMQMGLHLVGRLQIVETQEGQALRIAEAS
jgi:hypothetical protein